MKRAIIALSFFTSSLAFAHTVTLIGGEIIDKPFAEKTTKTWATYRVRWVSLNTGYPGHGECMEKTLTQSWVRAMNEEYRGEIAHRLERCS